MKNKPKRTDFVLAGLSTAQQDPFTPVQVQKLFFLLDQGLKSEFNGKYFNFVPYNYGPFDKAVYDELNALAREGYVEIIPVKNWSCYQLTRAGQLAGEKVFDKLPKKIQHYITDVSTFVRKLTFTQLVTAIYKAFPHMKANSVFQG